MGRVLHGACSTVVLSRTWARAQLRHVLAWLHSSRVCHDNVQMLMSQDPTQQQECMQTFFSTCRELAKAFDPVDTSVAGTYATAFPMAAPVL